MVSLISVRPLLRLSFVVMLTFQSRPPNHTMTSYVLVAARLRAGTDWQQCTLHGQLNHTVSSIGDCVTMAKAVRCLITVGLPLISRCPSVTSWPSELVSTPTIIPSAQWLWATVPRCSRALSSMPVSTRMSYLCRALMRLMIRYDVSKGCTLQELSDSLCYSET